MPDVAKDVRMRTRTIEQHLSGRQHNHRFIRRIFSPEDLGERLRPFVFLDYIHGQIPDGGGFGFHPHSGIATVTFQQSIDIDYEDTTGQKGVVRARGIEYVQAGECLWHRASLRSNSEDSTGFQLWLSLPPELEEAPARAEYLPPEAVPQKDNVRVLLGMRRGLANEVFWSIRQTGSMSIRPSTTAVGRPHTTRYPKLFAFRNRTASATFGTRDAELYQIKVDNNGDAVEDLVFQLTFTGPAGKQRVTLRGPMKPNETGTANTLLRGPATLRFGGQAVGAKRTIGVGGNVKCQVPHDS